MRLSEHRSFLASNGKEAIEFLRTQPLPCIIFLDLMMPTMNGHEFLLEKQKHVQFQLIPTVVITGDQEIVKHSSSLPIVGCLLKPFDVEELLHYIDSYC